MNPTFDAKSMRVHADLAQHRQRCSTQRCHRRRRTRQVPTSALLGSLFGSTPPETLPDQLPAGTLAWLRQNGLPPQKLAARDCGPEGRGLVATSRIRQGDLLLQVPRPLALTAADAAAQSALGAAAERADLPAWSVLALFLVEAKASAASPWQPYISMLPESSNSVLEWKESQVEGLLAGTRLLEDARSIRSAADASWQQLQPLLTEPAAAAAFGGRPPSRRDFQWAFSMLLSRLVRLSALGDAEALVPWADLLNHSPAACACIDWDAGSASVVLRAEADAAPGEQLYVSYGSKTSGALLLSYGFVPDGMNAHEAVDLELALQERDPLVQQKAAALEACGLQRAKCFPLRLGAFPAGMVQYAAMLAAPEEAALQAAVDAQRGGEHLLGGSCRAAALTLVREGCAARLDAMAASAPAAATAAGGGPDAMQLSGLVAEVRARERRVLERAKFLLTQERAQLLRS